LIKYLLKKSSLINSLIKLNSRHLHEKQHVINVIIITQVGNLMAALEVINKVTKFHVKSVVQFCMTKYPKPKLALKLLPSF